MSKRIELKLYTALGTDESGDIKMVDYFFNHGDMHGKPFFGVTGSSFMWCSPDYIQEQDNIENVKDHYGFLWQECVKAETTKESEEEFCQGLIDSNKCNGSGIFLGHDDSYLYELDQDETFLKYVENNFAEKNKVVDGLYDEEIGTFACVGGGRCFSGDENNLKDYINPVRRSLHLVAVEFEAGKIDIETVERFLVDNDIKFNKVVK